MDRWSLEQIYCFGRSFEMPAKTSFLRIQMDATAKERLDSLCERRGMTHVAAISRLMHWFSQQDEVMQTVVLHSLSEGSMSTLAKSLLKNRP
jgi:hypothetical protein